MAFSSVSDFVAALRQYRLLEPGQLAELGVVQAHFSDPLALARELTERGWLTSYQVQHLFQGKGDALLLGGYALLEKVGEGGMGTVFKARNWKLGRVVAVKVIRPERLSNPDTVRRFRREVRAAAQFEHPNIVRALDADEVGGTHLLVMEYVAGVDLARQVKEQGPMPVGLACECIRQVVLGLQHAHERGLVHRDIKPHNLLLASRERERPEAPVAHAPGSPLVKILDMGLAIQEAASEESSGTLTQTGTVVGTPDYIAPEQTQELHQVDIRADLYSLGCTFYFLLSGRVPFPSGSSIDKMLKHRLDEASPLEKILPEVPAEVAGVVRKLMAKRPEDRYQTPAELAAVLANLLARPAAPTTPREVGPFARLDGPDTELLVRPRPTTGGGWPWQCKLAAGGVMLAVLGVLAVLLFRPWGSDEAGARRKPQSIEVVVEAGNLWQDTGVEVDADAEVKLQALGHWRKKGLGECSADGLEKATRDRAVWPDAPPLALLVRIGERAPFVAGSKMTSRTGQGGRLFVQANELDLEQLAGTLKLTIQGGRSVDGSAATPPALLPLQTAEAELKHFRVRQADPRSDRQQLWTDVAEFVRKQSGRPQALKAAGLLRELPSPLDLLGAATIPGEELTAAGDGDPKQAPPGLVAVLGEHRGRHLGSVSRVACSPDGKTVASAGDDGKVRLWDRATLRQLSVLGPFTGETSLFFSADGKLLAFGEPVQVWDLSGAFPKLHARLPQGWPLAFTPDGKALFVGDGRKDGRVGRWDLSGQGPKEAVQMDGHSRRVRSAAISRDGKTLITDSSQDNTVCVWDMGERLPHRRARLARSGDAYVANAALTADGRKLALPIGQDVQLWDLGRPEPVKGEAIRIEDHVYTLDFAPDGMSLALGTSGGLRLFDLSGAKPTERFRNDIRITSLAFSPDGGTLVGCDMDRSRVRLWDLGARHEVLPPRGHTGSVTAVAFAPDCRTLASGGYDLTARLWNVGLRGPREGAVLRGHGNVVRAVTFPSRQTLISASQDATVQLWDLGSDGATSRQILKQPPHPTSLAVSPDEKTLVVGDAHHSVGLWNLTEKNLGPGTGLRCTGSILSVALSPDGRTLAAGGNGGVRWWGLGGREPRERPLLPHPSTVMWLAFAPDGRTLATDDASTVAIWDLNEARAVKKGTLEGTMPGPRFAYSPDGRTLAGAGLDGRMVLWDAVSRKQVREWRSQVRVLGIAFAADGRHFATANGNGTVYLFRLGPPGK